MPTAASALRLGALAAAGALSVGVASTAWADGDEPKCFGKRATIVGAGAIDGTPANDVIVGSDSDDVIDGQGGDDRICGLAGADLVEGGLGDDRLDGGAGDDTVAGDVAADVGDVVGGGDDRLL